MVHGEAVGSDIFFTVVADATLNLLLPPGRLTQSARLGALTRDMRIIFSNVNPLGHSHFHGREQSLRLRLHAQHVMVLS